MAIAIIVVLFSVFISREVEERRYVLVLTEYELEAGPLDIYVQQN